MRQCIAQPRNRYTWLRIKIILWCKGHGCLRFVYWCIEKPSTRNIKLGKTEQGQLLDRTTKSIKMLDGRRIAAKNLESRGGKADPCFRWIGPIAGCSIGLSIVSRLSALVLWIYFRLTELDWMGVVSGRPAGLCSLGRTTSYAKEVYPHRFQ